MVLIPGVNSRKVGVGTFDAERSDPNHRERSELVGEHRTARVARAGVHLTISGADL